jgi:hypothetical protein
MEALKPLAALSDFLHPTLLPPQEPAYTNCAHWGAPDRPYSTQSSAGTAQANPQQVVFAILVWRDVA